MALPINRLFETIPIWTIIFSRSESCASVRFRGGANRLYLVSFLPHRHRQAASKGSPGEETRMDSTPRLVGIGSSGHCCRAPSFSISNSGLPELRRSSPESFQEPPHPTCVRAFKGSIVSLLHLSYHMSIYVRAYPSHADTQMIEGCRRNARQNPRASIRHGEQNSNG